MPQRQPKQEHFLGALLGMAIGDAMGMPIASGQVEPPVATYGGRRFPDGAEIKPGEFTDESEIVLCIVESATLSGGLIDVDNIAARLQHLEAGESRRWMRPETAEIIATLGIRGEALVLSDEAIVAGADVLARGIPVGMLHALTGGEPGELAMDAALVTRLTHGDAEGIAAVTAVAEATRRVIRSETDLKSLWRDLDTLPARADSEPWAVIESAFRCLEADVPFQSLVLGAVNLGGAADCRGALVGALAGAQFGVQGIPQWMIDQLEARIYISLAAPWFYRAAQRRFGTVIDLQLQPFNKLPN